jgi:hypothetical protein
MAEDIRQVRDEVAAAREDLAQTIEALAYKVNAPRRFKERVAGRISAIRMRVTVATREATRRITVRSANRRGVDDRAPARVAAAASPPSGADGSVTAAPGAPASTPV